MFVFFLFFMWCFMRLQVYGSVITSLMGRSQIKPGISCNVLKRCFMVIHFSSTVTAAAILFSSYVFFLHAISLAVGNHLVTVTSAVFNCCLLCPPHWGVDILFLLFPASGRLVSTHLKEKYLSSLYQIWYGCLFG